MRGGGASRGGEGTGIALGTSSGDLASSVTTNPSLVSFTGNTLSMSFQTGSSVPSGDIRLRLFAGESVSGLSVGLFNRLSFDNVGLSFIAIPEPNVPSLWLGATGLLWIFRKRSRMVA